MPTQEERLTALEQTVSLLQRRSSTEMQDTNRNVTMLLGIASGQELDIKEIKTTLNEHTTLLTEILARLPEKP